MRTPLRPLTRRGLLTGTLGSAALLATGGQPRRLRHQGRATQTEAGCVSDDLSGHREDARLLQLAAVHGRGRQGRVEAAEPRRVRRRSGIQVTYTEDINDNNEFFGKVQNQLAGCQSTGRDIIVLTDWMAARMIRLGWIQKLDPAKMPNVEANLLPSLRGAPSTRRTGSRSRGSPASPGWPTTAASPARSAPSTSCSPAPTSRAR